MHGGTTEGVSDDIIVTFTLSTILGDQVTVGEKHWIYLSLSMTRGSSHAQMILGFEDILELENMRVVHQFHDTDLSDDRIMVLHGHTPQYAVHETIARAHLVSDGQFFDLLDGSVRARDDTPTKPDPSTWSNTTAARHYTPVSIFPSPFMSVRQTDSIETHSCPCPRLDPLSTRPTSSQPDSSLAHCLHPAI